MSIISEGSKTFQCTSDALISLVESIKQRDSTSESSLIRAANSFIKQLAANTKLDVRTLIPTSLSTALGQPIVISGTNNQATSTSSGSNCESNNQIEAFVIDLSQMPECKATQLELHNIDLAIILGSAVITGGSGCNVLRADAKSQFIKLGPGNDTLSGGGGDDTVASAGGNDLLNGGRGKDLITGGAGNDSLKGGPQADSLHGGRGDDLLSGSKGQDTLRGSSGDDLLKGKAFRDRLKGGKGNDTLFGGKGQDSLKGSPQADSLHGGRGDDLLSGGKGQDTLRGSSGDDLLKGKAFRDRLKGGKGNDTLFGGKGQDTLTGGEGSDTFKLSKGKDTIRDFSITDGDLIDAPDHLNLRLIQRGNHLLLKDLDNDIKTTLLNFNRDNLLTYQPEFI